VGEDRPPLAEQLWAAVSPGTVAAPVEVTGTGGDLPSRFAVEEAAVACVGVALRAAAVLHERRGGPRLAVGADRGQVAAAVRSERYFSWLGRPAGAGFAPLSRFWRAAGGWVRTHANYPWHRAALLGALGCADDAGEVAAAVARLPADVVENRVVAEGGVAAAVRSAAQWRDHPQGLAVAAEPLVGRERLGDAVPRQRPAQALPASGVRVLDLTRVIAGPVGTRFLGALGADVLRLDPPGLPDLVPGAPADGLLAKRSAPLDLATAAGAAALHRLLDGADVVVCGYRPGALDRFGLAPADLADRHPGLVAIYLSAWGRAGPWARRRGFDSIVQAAAGIAAGESADEAAPGALPCQLLDHGTGYLAAAAALDGLRCQAERGGTQLRYVSLAGTAWWLISITAPPAVAAPAVQPPGPARWMVTLPPGDGTVTAVSPPGRLGDSPLRWPVGPARYRRDRPQWLSR
jgi:CoA transferase family III